jgi:hypothetical protein
MTKYSFQEAIEQFADRLSSEHVHIQPTEINFNEGINSFQFKVKIVINDKYINSPLDLGFAECFNTQFYQDADKLGEQFFGDKPSWNNTKHTGWFHTVNSG